MRKRGLDRRNTRKMGRHAACWWTPMRFWTWFFVALLVSAGCTSGDRFDDLLPFASGSRLQVMVYDGGEGALRADGVFRDTTLDLDCRFAQAEDRTWRCFPTSSSGAALRYADPRCLAPI